MSIYLSIDLGTTGCRSILFNKELTPLAYAYEEYGLITPKENWVEQDANLWWELTLRTASTAISKAGINGSEIDSISISSQGITAVPVDSELNPMCLAHTWLDNRAEKEVEQITSVFSKEELYHMSGREISPCYTVATLLWFKNNRPEIFDKAFKFLMPLDFLIARFTGKCVTDHSMASGTILYDLRQKTWSRKVLDFLGISEEKLPSVAYSGQKVGCVLPKVAEQLGLRPDCVVAVGAQDQKCAAYGVGLDEGVMSISLGTAAAISKRWNEPLTEIDAGGCWCSYVLPDTYVTEGIVGTAGTCLRWTRDMLFKSESYATIDEEAKAARDRGSSLLFFPYLAGKATSDFSEEEGCFYGANLSTVRGDFALAVMEGIAFRMRAILEAMKAYGNVHTLVLFGGGANSDLWSQIIADATGMKISIPNTTEAAGAGAARLAAMAVGEMLPPLKSEKYYTPSALAAEYDKKYQRFRAVEKKLWNK